jgi:hypothetical protein
MVATYREKCSSVDRIFFHHSRRSDVANKQLNTDLHDKAEDPIGLRVRMTTSPPKRKEGKKES